MLIGRKTGLHSKANATSRQGLVLQFTQQNRGKHREGSRDWVAGMLRCFRLEGEAPVPGTYSACTSGLRDNNVYYRCCNSLVVIGHD
jgi:hypothetical protein